MIAQCGEGAGGRCDSLEACAARLEALPLKVPLWKRMLVPAVACAALALAGFTGYHFYRYRHVLAYYSDTFYYGDPKEESLLPPDASPRERLLLFGDTSRSDATAGWKALWDSDPQNAAYFAHYARVHFIDKRRTLPPDYRETAARLDPDNAYFVMLESVALSSRTVEDNTPRAKRGAPLPVPTYLIKDQARLDEAMALMQKAATMPVWRSYELELLRDQRALLPEAPGQFERLSVADYFQRKPYLMVDIDQAVAAKAEQLANAGDREGFLKLLEAWEGTALPWWDARPETMMSVLLGRVDLTLPLVNFRAAAEKLGLSEIAAKYAARKAAVTAFRGDPPHDGNPERKEAVRNHGAHVISANNMTEAFLDERAEPIPKEALEPGRRAEFDLLYQVASIVACVVFGIAGLLVAAYRFRGGLMARRLSLGMSGLLTGLDRAWIIGGGVAAPFLAWQLLSRFTPLGVKDWSPGLHSMIVPIGQWLACLVLMLALPLVIARWRLNRRTGRILPRTRRSWIAWGFMALAATAILVFWIAFKMSLPEGIFGGGDFINVDIADAERPVRSVLWAATGLIALVLGWLLIAAVRAIASSRGRVLRRVTTSRVLVQAYAAAMLVVALALPFFRMMEKRWVTRDELTRVTAESVPTTKYDSDAARGYRQRFLKIFQTKE